VPPADRSRWQARHLVRRELAAFAGDTTSPHLRLRVGDDANLPLLSVLARQDGLLEHVLSTEPADFKLNSFLSKIGRSPIGQLQLAVAPEAAVDLIYPLQDSVFSGSLASWVGQYQARSRTSSLRFMACATRTTGDVSQGEFAAGRSQPSGAPETVGPEPA